MRFKLDLMQTFDILAQKDPKLFLRTGNRHFILSPQTRAEVHKTIDLLKSRFHKTETQSAQAKAL